MCEIRFSLKPEAIGNKNFLIPVRNVTGRCTTSRNNYNFPGIIGTVNVICGLVTTENNGDVTAFLTLFCDVISTEGSHNLPQRHPREAEDELEQSDFSAPRDPCSLSLSLAAAVSANQITLLGVTDPARTRPWNSKAVCLGNNTDGWPSLDEVLSALTRSLNH